MIGPLPGGDSGVEPHDDSVAAERPVHPENTDSAAEGPISQLIAGTDCQHTLG